MANEAGAQFWQSLSVEGKEARFGLNIAGWTLVVLNLLAALDSMVFFLVVLRAGIVGWLLMNSCVPIVRCYPNMMAQHPSEDATDAFQRRLVVSRPVIVSKSSTWKKTPVFGAAGIGSGSSVKQRLPHSWQNKGGWRAKHAAHVLTLPSANSFNCE